MWLDLEGTRKDQTIPQKLLRCLKREALLRRAHLLSVRLKRGKLGGVGRMTQKPLI